MLQESVALGSVSDTLFARSKDIWGIQVMGQHGKPACNLSLSRCGCRGAIQYKPHEQITGRKFGSAAFTRSVWWYTVYCMMRLRHRRLTDFQSVIPYFIPDFPYSFSPFPLKNTDNFLFSSYLLCLFILPLTFNCLNLVFSYSFSWGQLNYNREYWQRIGNNH